MTQTVKSGLLRAWSTLPLARSVFRPLLNDRAAIFTLHRFSDPERGVAGHDPASLARALEYFRKRRYEIVELEELFRRLAGEGAPVKRALAFTIDDGYYDQATVGSPVFAAYDCPVTTFVATGFIDGDIWFWWDQIEFVFARTPLGRFSVVVADEPVEYTWKDERQRDAARLDFVARCKRLPSAEKQATIKRFADVAEVEVPDSPPPKYAPMSWDQLRSCERGTMSFGPHTVTHPILSRTEDREARREVLESWSRLQAEATRPVAVFSYPNGQPGDFGVREIEVLQSANFLGAVVGSPGYAHGPAFRGDALARFAVRRFGWPSEFTDAVQYASGLERFKQILRNEAA